MGFSAFLGFEALTLQGIRLEDIDGFGHAADFVLAVPVGDLCFEPPLHQSPHNAGDPADRARDRFRQDVTERESQHHGDARRGQEQCDYLIARRLRAFEFRLSPAFPFGDETAHVLFESDEFVVGLDHQDHRRADVGFRHVGGTANRLYIGG